MSSVKVHVIGRLGADATVMQTKNGKEFSKFTIAVDDFVGGEKATTWFAVADFSEVAKRRAEFLKKGSLIEVQGIETCRIYLDRNNHPQIARDIRATHIDFISTSRNEAKEESAVDCGSLTPSQQTTTIKTETVHPIQTTPMATQEVSQVSSQSNTSSDDLFDDLPF